MASKQNLSLDDIGLGDDFSDATMDFGVQQSRGGKRSPIMDLGKIAAKGAVSGVTDGSFIRQQIKKTLPQGYGTALDFADETATTFKSLYNTTATQMRPLTNDLKRTTQRLMPAAGQILPEKMRRTLDTWSKDIGDQSKYNPEDAIKAQIQQAQNDVFQYEFKQRQTDRAENLAKQEIKEGIDQTRFVTSAKILNTISLATQRLADYQDKVTINYQRKMLELQYRHVYLLRDTHEEQKRQGAILTEGFKALIHNTGLPDYEKLSEKNRVGGFMRNQFASMAGGGLRSARMNFMGKLRGSLENTIKTKVGDFANNAQNALMMGNMMLDAKEQMDAMQETMGAMGEHDYGLKGAAAGMAGGWAGQYGAGKGLEWLKKYLDKNPQVLKRGNQLQGFFENLPQHAHRFANSTVGEGKNPLLDILLGFGKDTLNDALKPDPTNLHRSDYSNLQGASVYTNQANKSITEIIPGYLARILREITVNRTGDKSTPLMVYDYKKNRFDTQRNSERTALSTAFSSYGVQDIKDRSANIAKMVEDPENPFTRDEKRALADHLLRLHRRGGGIADAKTLSNANNFTGLAEPHGERLSGAFSRYFADDENHSKYVQMSRHVNALSAGIEERKAVIQDLANAGHLEMLQRAGIVDEAGENINMDRFYALHLEDDPVMAAVGEQLEAVAPSREGRRRRIAGFRMSGEDRRPRQRVNLRNVNRAVPAAPVVGMPPAPGGYEFQGPPHPPIHTEKITQALNWNDAEEPIKKATDRLHEDLLRIEASVQAGIKVSNYHMRMRMPGMPDLPDMDKLGEHLSGLGEQGKANLNRAKGFFDRSLREHFRSARDTVRQRGLQGYEFVQENAPKARDFVADQYENLRDRGRRGWGKFQDTKNVYLPGEKMPRLMTAKLKAGEYLDDATGKVIQSYKDIRGAIRDKVTDEIVLTDDEAKAAFVRFGPVQKLITTLGAVIRPIRDAAGMALDRAHSMTLSAAAIARANIQKVKDYLDGPQDVYIAGSMEPVMLARIMRAGGYRLKMDPTKVISKITEISGPVIDSEGNEVLSMADLKAGIYDRAGRPLKTGWVRGAQIVGDFVGKYLNTAKNKLAVGLKKAKDAGLYVGGKAVDAAKQGWDAFSQWIGIDGIMISGGKTIVERLTEIRDLLNDRMPGGSGNQGAPSKYKRGSIRHRGPLVVGDQDGDGIRDGSVQDILKKRAEAKAEAHKAKEDAELEDIDKELGASGPIAASLAALSKKLGKSEGGLFGGLGGGLMDLLSDIPGLGKLLKKIPGIGKLGKLASKIPGLGRLGGLVGAGEAAAAGEGIAAAGAGAAGVAGAAAAGGRGLLSGGARLLGKGLMAAPGAALTAGKWLLNARNMGGIGGFALGGAGDAFGSMVMSGLGMAGEGLLAALGSPVVLGVAATAAAGYGAYKAYEYFKNHKSLDPMNSLRYAQYGFMPTDKDHVQAVFSLEDMLSPNVHFDSRGMASLNMKKIVAGNLFKLFGIDEKNNGQLTNFANWFVRRFKPIYLTHLTILHRLNGSTTLAGVDKLKDDQKRDYVNGAKYPDGPYDITVSPFPDLDKLPARAKDVSAAAETAIASIKGKGDGKDKAVQRATDGKGLRATQKIGGETATPKLDAKGKLVAKALTNNLKNPTAQAVGTTAAIAGGIVAGTAMDPTKGVDALTAVRLKTYGLTSLEPEKVQVLLQMEAAVEAKLQVKAAPGVQETNHQKAMQAVYVGDDMSILHVVGSRFDVIGEAGDGAFAWRKWFGARFLPTYLAYRGALATQTGQTKKSSGEQQLVGTPAQAVMVAQAVVGAQSQAKYGGGSVWKQTTSPWPKYELNTDSNSTKANIQSLNQRTGRETLPEAKAKMVQKAKTTPKSSDTKTADKPSAWDSLKKTASDVWTSVKSAVSGAYDSTKNAVSSAAAGAGAALGSAWTATKSAVGTAANTVSTAVGSAVSGVGQKIGEIGKGLGGLAKSLPDPKGSGTWASVKDLITSAAQMVGVDPALMGTMAAIESGFKWDVKAGTSSATGLYQFITSTWNNMIRQFGPKYGIPAGTSPKDPKANALMGAEYVKQNAAILSSKLKRPLTDTDIYAAHFLGPGGAVQLLTADPNANAVQLMPAAAKANAPIFTDRGQPRTVGQVISYLNSLVAKRGAQFGVGGGSAAGTTADASKTADKSKDAGGIVKTAGATAPIASKGAAPVAGASTSDPMAQARAVATATPAAKPSSGTGAPAGFGGSAPRTAGVPEVQNPIAPTTASSAPVPKDTLTQDMSNIHADQLKSLKSIESILTDIRQIVSGKTSGNGAASTASGTQSNPSPANNAMQQATEMTRGPVSMAKKTFGVT
jgi:hypothetical protein